MSFPETVQGVRTRTLSDGSMLVVRASKSIQKELDEKYRRVRGEMRWLPTLKDPCEEASDIQPPQLCNPAEHHAPDPAEYAEPCTDE